MNTINKNNYEAFFLDYYEGNLSPQQVADLLLFVEQHPEVKQSFESFENFKLEDYSSFIFENKEQLKKEITLDNKEDYFIRAVENTLNPEEQKLLNTFLKEHPHVLVEFELFQKTKLYADTTIVFEAKDNLKHFVFTTDDLLISSIEGVLTESERLEFNKRLATNTGLQNELSLYQQTKLVADYSVVFEDKETLKRKEKKVIPFYYYVAIAASLILLFGLFSLFNRTGNETKLAEVVHPSIKQQPINIKLAQNTNSSNRNTDNNFAKAKTFNSQLVKKQIANNKAIIKKDSEVALPTADNTTKSKNNIEPQLVLQSTNQEIKKDSTLALIAPITTKKEPLAVNKNEDSNEFLSLKEIAVTKLKENTIDKNTLEAEKKSGRLKRLSGWDFAQVAAKGISKLTGKEVKVEPTYNEQGDVTAYALGAGGFEISRGR